jgi:hypothetical protein
LRPPSRTSTVATRPTAFGHGSKSTSPTGGVFPASRAARVHRRGRPPDRPEGEPMIDTDLAVEPTGRTLISRGPVRVSEWLSVLA